MFFVGRFITGVGVGISCFALPLYSAEISTASIRGATGSLFQLNVVAPRNEKLDIIFPCKNLPKNGVFIIIFSWNHHWDSQTKASQQALCWVSPVELWPEQNPGAFLTKGRLGTSHRFCMPDSLGEFPPKLVLEKPISRETKQKPGLTSE